MSMSVYLSFKCTDADKASVLKDLLLSCGASVHGFDESIDFYAIKQQGQMAVLNWIQTRLSDSHITVVIIGQDTCESDWVKQEIMQSIIRGSRLLFVNMRAENEHSPMIINYCMMMAQSAPLYHWENNQGSSNFLDWVNDVSKVASATNP